jgi:hypothetical protein
VERILCWVLPVVPARTNQSRGLPVPGAPNLTRFELFRTAARKWDKVASFRLVKGDEVGRQVHTAVAPQEMNAESGDAARCQVEVRGHMMVLCVT